MIKSRENNQELISNLIRLNSNKPILCSKSGVHPTEAEGQKTVSGIIQLVKMQKGIVVKGVTQIGITRKGITQKGITQMCITRKDITQIGITRKGITRKGITRIGSS